MRGIREAVGLQGRDQDVVVALHHGQGPQPRSSCYLKRHIFRNPDPCYGPNKTAPFVLIGLKPAGPSGPILILPFEVQRHRFIAEWALGGKGGTAGSGRPGSEITVLALSLVGEGTERTH